MSGFGRAAPVSFGPNTVSYYGAFLQPLTINPEGLPTLPSACDHISLTPLSSTSKLVTLAGLTGYDPAGADNATTVPEQAAMAYAKLKTCLAAAGATPRDIVQVKHYVVKDTGDPNVDSLDIVDRGWGDLWVAFMDKHANGHRPPQTVIGVACLAKKEILYECEVWAIVNPEDSTPRPLGGGFRTQGALQVMPHN
ncbi:hypothetical protein PFICI_02643 [Pestalotiopsis fici W106-1]|uniref:Uncharacterized protein n=1 Tax=Pestalotiopsis fici (strain W106-1 / CGMCC3.15140) TaxID=1229662 RepID=W3XEU2_PESFW|nr:uncharacterized protein PFICI_02643 [Pestalotiopsis fici W106-1]ETS84618.1 hypothetical protein PFICI_02643 [Pestalotiopsis fici W106-1]